MTYAVVVPTAGRPSLATLLAALADGDGPRPERVVLVDDRPNPAPGALSVDGHGLPVTVVRAGGRGPAAARNAGWRACDAEWIAFLDDDVAPQRGWRAALAADLAAAGPDVGGSQGRLHVPLPVGRQPTDWERNVKGLETAQWATADLAYRRSALAAIGGFDERFPRAYREDADLGLRMTAAGWRIVRGRRRVTHPVGAAPASVSIRKQAGNADDVLMRALHGRDWRSRAGVPRGRRPRHVAITVAGAIAVGAGVRGARGVAAVAGAAWLAGTAELAWARIAPGPRTPREAVTMLWTSAVLPVAATAWWLRGWCALPRMLRASDPQRAASAAASQAQVATSGAAVAGDLPAAVLFDRDGTLVVDVPYNGDPARVEPVPGARAALARLRAAGIPTAVVSNQSGIARGLLTEEQVRAVNARIEELLGPLGPWHHCPHGPDDACGCRKPAPGLVLRAARDLGVDPSRCALVGDIGADVEAARAAGARPVLVPTPRTRPEEVAAAPEVAADIEDAVERLLRSAA